MSRSSGPSKFSSLTGYASRADSKSGVSGAIVELVPSAIQELHGLAHAVHLLGRLFVCAGGSLEQQIAHVIRLRENLGAALPHRFEESVQRGGQLRLDLDVADLS